MTMLDGIPLTDFSAPTILGIAILLLLFGKIVPRSTLADKERESERWRLAYEAEKEARITSDAQTAELLEVAKTTNSIVVAMYGTAERIRQTSGATHVDAEG